MFVRERLRDDPDVLEIRRNSEWYRAMPSTDLIDELGRVTHGRLVSRDTQSANDEFGRLMTLNDELIGPWARVYTTLPLDEVDQLQRRADRGGADARDAKLDLAAAIVARYHGQDEADRARRDFRAVFSERQLPDEIAEIPVSGRASLLDLVMLARPELSGSAARRLIAEGGVRVNGAQIRDPQQAVAPQPGDVLRAGKLHWFRLRADRQ